jgi:hypothetical protein
MDQGSWGHLLDLVAAIGTPLLAREKFFRVSTDRLIIVGLAVHARGFVLAIGRDTTHGEYKPLAAIRALVVFIDLVLFIAPLGVIQFSLAVGAP